MRSTEAKQALGAAVDAAHEAGAIMRRNLRLPKKVNSAEQHDIKLELDVRCQKLIERKLRIAFPTVAFLGEEGIAGDPFSSDRWVVDPIDGTVNFTRSEAHTSELQSRGLISYAVFCLKKNTRTGWRSDRAAWGLGSCGPSEALEA